MIACLGQPTHLSINAGTDQTAGKTFAGQQMIETQSAFLFYRIRLSLRNV